MNPNLFKLFSIGLMTILLNGSSGAQTSLPTDATSTNVTPEVFPPIEGAPVVTNQFPATTNLFPSIKPKTTAKTSGAYVLSSVAGNFGGNFSVSGRTLRFPVPQSTPRSLTNWRRNLDFGMNMAQGNSDTLRYSLGVDTVKEKEANTIRFRAHGTYGESDGTKDTENAGATLRYERQLTKKIYALSTLDWATDPIAELDYRFTGILSPGFHLYRTKTTILNFEIGAGYVEEKKDQNEDGYTAGRAALTTEKLINDHTLIWATSEYIPKLADTSVFFINSEIGLASYITRDLSLTLCYQNRYDSSPVEGKTESDTIFSTALSLNF